LDGARPTPPRRRKGKGIQGAGFVEKAGLAGAEAERKKNPGKSIF